MAHLDGTQLDKLWDFDDPAATEERLRAALEQADGAMSDELRTQVARALGLQGAFAEALTMLDGISPDDAVVQQRIALERGRVLNASGEVAQAIAQFQEAYRVNADTYLTVDAIHMLGITDKAEAATWYERGLEIVQHSHDARVQRWEGPLRNDQAWNLADEGNLEAALQLFREAEAWFRAHGTPQQVQRAESSIAEVMKRMNKET